MSTLGKSNWPPIPTFPIRPTLGPTLGSSGFSRCAAKRPPKALAPAHSPEAEAELPDYLPFGAYAVISTDLTADQTELVNQAIDGLRAAGVKVTDQRDVDEKRYRKELVRWHENVLDRVRAEAKRLIAKKKQLAEAEGRKFKIVDDELRIIPPATSRNYEPR